MIQACGSETPNIWGWSRNPILQITCEQNIVEDTIRGIIAYVESGQAAKSSAGRAYLSGTICQNVVRYSPAFTASNSKPQPFRNDDGQGGKFVSVQGNRVDSGNY